MGTIKDTIAKNIMFYRKKLKMSQKTLGELVGVNNTAISNWENGNNSIDIETLFKVCKALGISIETVFGNEDSNYNFFLEDSEIDYITKYRQLDNHGKDAVNGILDLELKRITCYLKYVGKCEEDI